MTPATATALKERPGHTDEEIALFARCVVAALDRPGGLEVLCNRIDVLLAQSNARRTELLSKPNPF